MEEGGGSTLSWLPNPHFLLPPLLPGALPQRYWETFGSLTSLGPLLESKALRV